MVVSCGGGDAACRLAAGAVAELVDGGVGASAAGFGGAVAGFGGTVADFGSGLALATVIDHALDDGLAKAHDVVVVDGGAGCEQAVANVHVRPAEQLDGKRSRQGSGKVVHQIVADQNCTEHFGRILLHL